MWPVKRSSLLSKGNVRSRIAADLGNIYVIIQKFAFILPTNKLVLITGKHVGLINKQI